MYVDTDAYTCKIIIELSNNKLAVTALIILLRDSFAPKAVLKSLLFDRFSFSNASIRTFT